MIAFAVAGAVAALFPAAPAIGATGSSQVDTRVTASGTGSDDCTSNPPQRCPTFTYSFSGVAVGPSPVNPIPGAFQMYVTLPGTTSYDGPTTCQVYIDDGHGDTLLAYDVFSGACSVKEIMTTPPTFAGDITANLQVVNGTTGSYTSLIGQYVHLSGTVGPMIDLGSVTSEGDPPATLTATITAP